MENIAGNKECDGVIAIELIETNIPHVKVERVTTEVPYSIIGELHGWTFRRAWNYWMVDSPKGFPLSVATELHELEEAGNMYGDFIRVDEFARGVHPNERNCDGFVSSYYIDTQVGLNKFVEYVNKYSVSEQTGHNGQRSKRMIKVKEAKILHIECDNPDDTFSIRYTNMGEPFREGIEIGIENKDFNRELMVMLENSDAKRLRDFLISYYPI